MERHVVMSRYSIRFAGSRHLSATAPCPRLHMDGPAADGPHCWSNQPTPDGEAPVIPSVRMRQADWMDDSRGANINAIDSGQGLA